jgi:serine/threonine protein kinase
VVEPERSWSWSPGHELAPGLLAWALLGDGQRCETWLAWDVGRWCPVAVKLPRPAPASPSPRPAAATRAVAALAREAQVAGPTAHPAIRRLLESRLDQPLPHLVFEYVEGPTLDDALADEGPFHPIDVLLVGMQLAAALGHLHDRGLAHLDVKPGNVVMRDGRPVLIDLGLARPVGGPAPAWLAAVDGPPERSWPQLAGPPPTASSRNAEVRPAVDQAIGALLAPTRATARPPPLRCWPCWPRPCRPTPARRTGCGPTGPPGASPDGQPPPWSVPRRFHDLRRHCRWQTGQMPLVRMVARGKTAGRTGPVPEQALVGARGAAGGCARSPGAGLPRGAEAPGPGPTADPRAPGW